MADFWDSLAGKADPETPAAPSTPTPVKQETRDWLDEIVDRQGMAPKRALVRSIYEQESSSGKANTSKPGIQGARGPLQVTEIAFRDMQQRGYIPKEYKWDNPQHSAEAGVAYLKHALKQHGDDDEKAAAFYFGGPDAIGKDGSIRRERMDANKKTIGAYVDDVKKRIGASAKTQTAGSPAQVPTGSNAKVIPWEDVIADPSFAALNSDQREAVRAQYFEDVVKPTIPEGQEAAIRQQFDADTQLSWFDNARLSLKQTGSELKEGVRNLTQGMRGVHLTSGADAVRRYKEEAAVARAQGDETTAQEREAQAAQIDAETRKLDAEIVGSDKASTFVPRLSVAKMLQAKTKEEAWEAFKADPINIIAGITAQSAPAMAPGLVAAAIAAPAGAVPAALALGASSGFVEFQSALLDFARENGVKSEPGALVDFYSKEDNLKAGMAQAARAGGIVGAFDAATAGIASKTLAPKALTSAVAKQAVNVPAQMVVQAAGGAAGEATKQIVNKGEITEPGQVLAEAVGEFATAPVDVAVLARDVAKSPDATSKANKLRDIAKRLRGEPIESDAVVDNPTDGGGGGGPLAVAPQRGVAGVPVPKAKEVELREKVDPKDVEVLDAGDEGTGKRPALPKPAEPAPLQIENRPTSEGRTDTIRVDSKGIATPELQSEGKTAAAARAAAEELGTTPTRVPAKPVIKPIPKKKRGKGLKSMRSEYSAYQALADRAQPGWTSPSGKTIEEVLAARPKPQQPTKPGKPLASKKTSDTPRAVTKTEPFRRWFGASKATDEQGQPKVWFRGTATDNDTPRPRQAGAIFVAPDAEFAEMFSHKSLDHARKNIGKVDPAVLAEVDAKAREQVRKNYTEQGVDEETLNYYLDNVRMTDEWLYAVNDVLPVGPNVQPYYVRAERPFDMDDAKSVDRLANRVMGDKGEAKLTSTSKGASQNINRRDLVAALKRGDWTVLESDEVQAAIKDLGHDSFYVTEGGRKNLAVYSPNQIKSATGNSGEFNLNNPSVTHSKQSVGGIADMLGDLFGTVPRERGVGARALQEIVDAFAKEYKGANALNILVYKNHDEAVAQLGRAAMNDDTKMAEGLYFGDSGYVILIADKITNAGRAAQVLLHEIVGHYGIERVVAAAGPGFEKRWIAILNDVAKVMNDGSYVSMQSVAETYGNVKLINAMEVLARMAETGVEHTLLTRTIALIRDALRKLGINLRMTKSDLIELVVKSRESLRAGSAAYNEEIIDWHRKIGEATEEDMAAMASLTGTPIWFSQLGKMVANLNIKAAAAKDWINSIRGMATKGVKKEEIEFTGILDWLSMQSGKVTKDDVVNFLAMNGVKIMDIDLGGEFLKERVDYAWDQVERELLDREHEGMLTERELDRALNEHGQRFNAVKTEDELYAALQEIFDGSLSRSILADAEDHVRGLAAAPQHSSLQLPGKKANYTEKLITLMPRSATEARYEEGHYSEFSNVLAHVRFNERIDADGKKVLFIEEIQSDWGQDGRKRGFRKGDRPEIRQKRREFFEQEQALINKSEPLTQQLHDAGVFVFGDKPKPGSKFNHPETGEELTFEQARDLNDKYDDQLAALTAARRALIKEQASYDDAVPAGPYVTKTDSWVRLVVKRMIREAIDRGADRVAFITGKQTVDRYSMSNVVENVSWQTKPDGNRIVDFSLKQRRYQEDEGLQLLVSPDGMVVDGDMRGQEFTDQPLGRVVGEEIAKSIMGKPVGALDGPGLEVGGSGHIAFYPNKDLTAVGKDKNGKDIYPIVQTVANDVLRTIGGDKMILVKVDVGQRGVLTQPGFEITPEMRGTALAGLPLFSKKKDWAPENAAFEVAPGGNAPIKAQWDALPAERRAEITEGIAKTIVPKVVELFTDEKAEIIPTTGGWMGGVNPSAALKMKKVKAGIAKNIAAAVAYVFDQDAGLHISQKGEQDSIVVVLEPGQDGAALYKSLPGNDKEFIGFTSSGDGVMEFLVDDAAKSAPKLQAHFGPAKVTVVQRGFGFLGPKDYKAARNSLDASEKETLDLLREQARSLMKISLSPDRKGAEVSTASSLGVRTWLDIMKQRIMVGIDHIFGLGPNGVDVAAALMEKMPNIRPKQGRTAAETIEHAIEHFKSNLLWLFDQVPENIRERSKLWYVGGNKIASQMSKFYGISTEQAAGVIATLSPQRDWFVNVSLARRVLDIWKYQQDFVANDAMYEAALADRTQQSESAKIAQERVARAIRGKKLSELTDLIEAATWIRAYDDAFNVRSYRIISPEGETMGLARNDDGSPASIQWGSANTIANAVSILRDGAISNISESLGDGHKVRSFYTNILNPKDALAATIDTHAVAAATLRPLSSDSPEVRNAFGGNEKGQRGPVTSKLIGSNGTYGIYHEAYLRAAAERGVSPREMQSITWEALRGMFSAAQKRTTSEPVEQLWNLYHRGKKTLAQVREELLEIADGITEPDWTRPDPDVHGEEEVALEDVRLSGAGWNDGVGSGGATAAFFGGRPLASRTVAASNGGSGVVEYSRRPPRPDSVAVNAWHWSHSTLTELSGSMYGSGIRGAEAERLRTAPPQIKKRVYFYTNRQNGTVPRREQGLGPNRHEVRLANLWKSGVSPSLNVPPVGTTQSGIFIRDNNATTNAWEMALLEAGYDGYVDTEVGVAVVLNSDVPVTFVKGAPLASKVVDHTTKAERAEATSPAHTGLVDGLFRFGLGWVGKRLTGPAYDYLVRQGARIVPEKVKHGLVSNYGLEGQYLDAKVDRTAAVNKVLRETKNLLDSLSSLTREQSRIAYLWMNEKPDTETEADLMSRLPAEDRQILRNMKTLIDRLGQDAVKVGLLTQDSYERNKMSYLHRVYAEHMADGKGTLSASAARAAAIRAENFKGRGIRHDVSDDSLIQNIDEVKQGDMLDRWEAKSPSGKVTSVKYLPKGRPGPAGYTNAGTWEARFFDKAGKVGMWRDLTADERQKLGEIEEVRFAFAKTVINGVRDIENARFLKWVAETYATTNAPAEKINSDPASGYWSTQTFAADEYVKVPDSEIRGTGIKKYGALAGKIIPAPIWNDVRNQLTRPSDGASAAWDALVRGWKVSKTALSPAVHTNNVMSNFIMADLAEVRARDIVKALQTIVAAKKGDPAALKWVERFEDSGADYGSFANIELNQLYIEPLLADLQKIENNELGLLKMSQIVDLAAQGQIGAAAKAAAAKAAWVKKPFEVMLKAYQSEDSVFRLAKFMREAQAGHPDREAGKMARDAFLDYNINAPWIQTARRSVLPFIAFSYRALPLMLRNAANKPWKFAKFFAVGSILNAAAYAMMGLDSDDEDRERRMLPEELSGRLLGVFPRLVRMPWNDEHGSPIFLDMRRWVPGGDMVDLNQSKAAMPVPSWLSVSGPLSIMMEFFSNKSSFTGQPITKDTDTPAETAAKVGDHLFKAFAPNLPLPGPGSILPTDRGQFQTYAWQGLLDAGTGRTDAFGRDQSLATAALSSIGVKARAYPEDALKLRAVQDFNAQASEIQRNIQSLARELSRGGITREQFDARVAREQSKLEKAGADLRKKVGE